jgi:predicted SAM-dependent methyltransferase
MGKILGVDENGVYVIDKSQPVKLDLGSGLNQMPHEDGWIHQDVSSANGIEIVCEWKKIPLESGIVDICRMGDIIEHIFPDDKDTILKEWNRILKIGAKVHLTTPNFDYSCREYTLGRMTLHEAQQNLYGDRMNQWSIHWGTYTLLTLRETLEKYGFGEIDFSESPGEKNCPWWIVANFIKINNV